MVYINTRASASALCLAVLGEGLTTHTTGQLAVEDKILLLQILILLRARIKTNLRQAVACQTSLAIRHGSPGATADLGGRTGHTAEMAALACQRTDS